jgi:hypothetical protein
VIRDATVAAGVTGGATSVPKSLDRHSLQGCGLDRPFLLVPSLDSGHSRIESGTGSALRPSGRLRRSPPLPAVEWARKEKGLGRRQASESPLQASNLATKSQAQDEGRRKTCPSSQPSPRRGEGAKSGSLRRVSSFATRPTQKPCPMKRAAQDLPLIPAFSPEGRRSEERKLAAGEQLRDQANTKAMPDEEGGARPAPHPGLLPEGEKERRAKARGGQRTPQTVSPPARSPGDSMHIGPRGSRRWISGPPPAPVAATRRQAPVHSPSRHRAP